MLAVRTLFIALLALFATPALAAKKPVQYAGEDGGYLVYGVGTIAIGMHFDFPYGRVAGPDGAAVTDWRGSVEPTVGGAIYLKVKNPDFEGRESGHVVTRRLPPGDYLIDNFAFYGSSPTGAAYGWSSAKPFAIRFRIEPGKATYIGSFMRAPSLGTSLEPTLGAAGFFVIADRSARDLPIAGTRLPADCPIVPQVTDVDAFGNPILRSAEP